MSPLQAEEIFGCLHRHGVRYVLIGGLAAVLHGSPLPTVDVDICPASDPENLGRLASALADLAARIRTGPRINGPYPSSGSCWKRSASAETDRRPDKARSSRTQPATGAEWRMSRPST